MQSREQDSREQESQKRIIFNISRFLMSKLGLRTEKFLRPSDKIKKALKKANLYI